MGNQRAVVAIKALGVNLRPYCGRSRSRIATFRMPVAKELKSRTANCFKIGDLVFRRHPSSCAEGREVETIYHFCGNLYAQKSGFHQLRMLTSSSFCPATALDRMDYLSP